MIFVSQGHTVQECYVQYMYIHIVYSHTAMNSRLAVTHCVIQYTNNEYQYLCLLTEQQYTHSCILVDILLHVCLSVCLSVCAHAMLIHNYWGLQMLYAPPPENETGSSFHIHWAHRPAHSSQISPESVSGCLCFSVVLHTHTHSYTPHLRSTSFLLEVSPTHTCTSKFSSLTRISPFGVTRGHAETWEEESPKGIQLSEENTKLGDIIPPL